jgi:hypothetical protein
MNDRQVTANCHSIANGGFSIAAEVKGVLLVP